MLKLFKLPRKKGKVDIALPDCCIVLVGLQIGLHVVTRFGPVGHVSQQHLNVLKHLTAERVRNTKTLIVQRGEHNSPRKITADPGFRKTHLEHWGHDVRPLLSIQGSECHGVLQFLHDGRTDEWKDIIFVKEMGPELFCPFLSFGDQLILMSLVIFQRS